MIDKRLRPTKLLWMDLEMTGLDPQNDVILEVAVEVTDFNFKTLASYETAIYQSEVVLERCNEWARLHHAASGLLERVRLHGKPEQEVVSELVMLIRKHFGDEAAVLAGNSIHQDRGFIRSWWPEVEELLHYRMLDVSSLKVYMQGKYDVEFEKKEAHRALEDIHESIAEWQYYMKRLREHKRT